MRVTEHALLDALLRNDLVAFTERVFREINPGQTFHPAWHHEATAYVAEFTTMTREMNRAIINLPPRSLKSILFFVALPAFLLGRDPTRRIIVISYNQELANDLSRKTRQVMQSEWYRRLFPSTRLAGRPAETEFHTTAGGFRKATSVSGTLTGRGGDTVIIDDPQKADDAYSQAARDSLADWANRTLPSRLDDKITGSMLLVQQRLHEDDLSGLLLRSGGWYHLALPARFETDRRLVLGRSPRISFHNVKAGDLLDPVREPQYILDDLRRQMGSSAYLAQYQQSPVPPDGDIVKVGWFQTYDELPEGGQRILSVDTASKAGLRNDYSVAMLWRVVDNRFYLEFVWRRKVDFPELLHSISDMARSMRVDTVLIEDKGHGTGLIQTLQEMRVGVPVVAYDPGSLDKESRMRIQSYKIEGKLVALPKSAPWLDDFLEEVRRFPNGAHDDQMDAMSQVLDYASRPKPSLFVGKWR